METQNECKKQTIPMTCIICPMGCNMEVTLDECDGKKTVTEVRDNGCPRGAEYAKKELLNPTRTLTTTISVTAAMIMVGPATGCFMLLIMRPYAPYGARRLTTT